MPSFDGVPWISVLASGLVVIPSLGLLLRTIGRERHVDQAEPAEDIDAVLTKIGNIRTMLTGIEIPNAKANSSQRGPQETDRGSSGQQSNASKNANAFADRIKRFEALLAKWCEITREHLASSQISTALKDLQRLENDARSHKKLKSDVSEKFSRLAASVTKKALPVTDRDFSGEQDRWKRLDEIIRELAKEAGLVLIEPSVGDIFDERKHQPHFSSNGFSQQRISRGNGKVSLVHTRGLDYANKSMSKEDVLLRAEVEVKI
jgi:hypothetical protein